MYEVISVKGNSVALRHGLIAFNVKVIEGTPKRIVLPNEMFVDSFKTLVRVVLDAYENSQVNEAIEKNENTKIKKECI